DIARIRDTVRDLSRCLNSGAGIDHRSHQCGRRRIVYLSRKYGVPLRVDLINRGVLWARQRRRAKKLAEVTLLLESRGECIHETRVDGAVIVHAVKIEEPEGLAELRNRPAQCKAPVVL